MPYKLGEQGAYGCSGFPVIVQRDGWVLAPGGCHKTKEEAMAHLGALKANVKEASVELEGDIVKVDTDHGLVFGWAYVSKDNDGTVIVDSQEDYVDDDWELEKSAYDYVVTSRDGSDTHLIRGVATLVESVVFTPDKLEKMGLPPGSMPTGWWVGMKVNSPAILEKVRSGEYTSFSIGGKGIRKRGPIPTNHRRDSR